MMIRTKYKKSGMMKYLSHLDLIRLFERAFRRAKIPMAYTQGFNPHPKVAFASPLSIGVSSQAEYFDLVLTEEIDPADFLSSLNQTLPQGIEILKVQYYEENKKTSLMKESALIEYQIKGELKSLNSKAELQEKTHSFMNQDSIIVEKKMKKNKYKKRNREKTKAVDIRPLISSFTVDTVQDHTFTLNLWIQNLDSGTVKPISVCRQWISHAQLEVDLEDLEIHRLEVYRVNERGHYEAIL